MDVGRPDAQLGQAQHRALEQVELATVALTPALAETREVTHQTVEAKMRRRVGQACGLDEAVFAHAETREPGVELQMHRQHPVLPRRLVFQRAQAAA